MLVVPLHFPPRRGFLRQGFPGGRRDRHCCLALAACSPATALAVVDGQHAYLALVI